ncbi:unnamed protein product [Euphydryas editha]|uniref:Uncharacterized protein n=1 Tax=Euphydryas editha TaxID=104508 RepID=A0AAU9TRT8_EUPED|nr:unnamed protein product [Euphydryas editha]
MRPFNPKHLAIVETDLLVLTTWLTTIDQHSLNELFQKDQVECLKLFEDLNDLLYDILQVIVVPQQLAKMNRKDLSGYNFQAYIMAVNHMNFGYAKNLVSQKFYNDIYGIKERFKLFLVTLGCELQKRVPKNIDVLKTMSLFSIQDMKLTFPKDISGIASTFKNISGGIVDEIVSEWNLVHKIQIEATTTDEFWSRVSQMTTASGEKRFGHISKLATSLLSCVKSKLPLLLLNKIKVTQQHTVNNNSQQQRQRQVTQLKTEVLRLRKRGLSLKARLTNATKLNVAFEKVTKNMTNPAKLFTGMQCLLTIKKPKGRRFTVEEKVLSLYII